MNFTDNLRYAVFPRFKKPAIYLLFFLCWNQLLLAENPYKNSGEKSPYPLLPYTVTNTYPHDTDIFTQGLYLQDKHVLFESGGGYGHSTLSIYDLLKKENAKTIELPNELFAEGITIFDEKLYLATWKAGKILVYSPKSLNLLSTHLYSNEMWGLTSDEHTLIISDGSEVISFIDPKTFKLVRKISVTRNHLPIKKINELEWVNGYIFANIWFSNEILVIQPKNGNVVATLDLQHLKNTALQSVSVESVLNGIAWNKKRHRLLVTGKNWKTLYEIKLDADWLL